MKWTRTGLYSYVDELGKHELHTVSDGSYLFDVWVIDNTVTGCTIEFPAARTADRDDVLKCASAIIQAIREKLVI